MAVLHLIDSELYRPAAAGLRQKYRREGWRGKVGEYPHAALRTGRPELVRRSCASQ